MEETTHVRVTPELKAAIAKGAAKAKRKESDFLRLLIEEGLERMGCAPKKAAR